MRHLLSDLVNKGKTKEQLIGELAKLRQRIAELEALVTEREKVEEALRESEERHRVLFDAAHDALFLEDLDGRILEVNSRACELLGYTRDELLQLTVGDLVPDEALRLLPEDFDTNDLKTGTRFETVNRHKDGHLVPVELSGRQISVGGEDRLLVSLRDITERKQAEGALRESEERYRDLFENASDLIQSVGADGHFIHVNQQWLDTLGYTADEAKGLHYEDILRPDQVTHCRGIFHQLQLGESITGVETVFVTKAGQELLVEGNLNARMVEGRLVATRGIFRDITERRRAEEALQEADRLKDEMLQNVSHELRMPLTCIVGYSELLLDGEMGELSSEQREGLGIVSSKAQTLVRLVSDIVALQSVGAGELCYERFKISDLLRQAVAGSNDIAQAAGVDLALDIAPDLPEVRADRLRIGQVLDNLLENAIKFSPGGGQVTVRGWAENGMAHVSVSDTGIGIPPEELERIFERFYQISAGPSRRFGGIGLGLSICKAIVETHSGRIWAESTSGQGSTFTFTLPMSE